MNALEFIGFLVLSLQWSELMRCWQMTESLPVFQNCTCAFKTGYMRRIRFIASIALILALGMSWQRFPLKIAIVIIPFWIISVEHSLCIGATLHSIIMFQSDRDVLTELIRNLVPHLVPQCKPLPIPVALLICYINESATFVWNFHDIFIMLIGYGLSTHFKLFNNELERAVVEVKVAIWECWQNNLNDLVIICFSLNFF